MTRGEFYGFIGLQLLIGVRQQPSLESYWSTDPKLSCSLFGATMSRNRFQEILRCLHFVDNKEEETLSQGDRLWKVRPLLNTFNNTMNRVYTPGPRVAIDEQNVLYRGRLVFRQYIPNKRHKYGIKVYYMVSESGTGIALK